MSEKPISKQRQELNAYHNAIKIQRSTINLLKFCMILLVIGIIAVVGWSQSTFLVSVPGQTFSVQRAFVNPYREYDAEQALINFTDLILQFDDVTYEENLESAKFFATTAAYNYWRDFYYVNEQPGTGEPAYFAWVKNDINVEIKISHIRSIENETGFIVEFYGIQTFRKEEDFFTFEDAPIHVIASVKPINSMTKKNRTGWKVDEMEMFNDIYTSEVKEEWETLPSN